MLIGAANLKCPLGRVLLIESKRGVSVKDQQETQFNVSVPKDVKKAVERLAIDTDAKVKEVVTEALKQYLKSYGVKL